MPEKEIKEKIKGWEKEFDKIWITPNEFVGNEKEPVFNLDIREKEIKSFIRQILAQKEKEILEEIERRLDYEKKYRLNSDYSNGFSGLESGECCEKCRIDPEGIVKDGHAVALRLMVGCRDPFQINCKCHIPFRKVAVDVKIATLEEIKRLLTVEQKLKELK